jgi:hypothetical protein
MFDFGVVFPLVVVVAILVGHTVVYARRGRAWEAFARDHGLTLRGSGRPVIEGRYHDAQIRVRLVYRGGGKSKRAVTEYRVNVRERMPAGFSVAKEGLLDRVGKFIGGKADATIGDPELDEALWVQGDDMDTIRLLQISEVGTAVLGMITAQPSLEIRQDVVLEDVGFADPEHLEQMLDALCDLARVLEDGCRRLAGREGSAPS